jgi:hypothetical protein
MVRKTRKQRTNTKRGIHSIPELRRSFEYIEEYINDKIALKESKDALIKDLRKEWSRVFFKELNKKAAEAFITDKLGKKHHSRRKTVKHHGGAGAQLPNTFTPIAGAPNDYTTRQGIYLAPGQIPDNKGHLPLSDGSKSNFGSYIQYVDKGFWNPEPGRSYDPVEGQTRFPTSTPVGMGDNTVHFASKSGGGGGGGGGSGGGGGRTSTFDKWSEEDMLIIVETLKKYSTMSLKLLRGHLSSKHNIDISESTLKKIKKEGL